MFHTMPCIFRRIPCVDRCFDLRLEVHHPYYFAALEQLVRFVLTRTLTPLHPRTVATDGFLTALCALVGEKSPKRRSLLCLLRSLSCLLHYMRVNIHPSPSRIIFVFLRHLVSTVSSPHTYPGFFVAHIPSAPQAPHRK